MRAEIVYCVCGENEFNRVQSLMCIRFVQMLFCLSGSARIERIAIERLTNKSKIFIVHTGQNLSTRYYKFCNVADMYILNYNDNILITFRLQIMFYKNIKMQ